MLMKNPNIEYLEMLKNSKFIFDKKTIKEELNYLAEDISEKLHNKNPLILTVMNNGLRYSSELQKKLKFPFRTGYIDYSNISHLKVPSDIITFDNLLIAQDVFQKIWQLRDTKHGTDKMLQGIHIL